MCNISQIPTMCPDPYNMPSPLPQYAQTATHMPSTPTICVIPKVHSVAYWKQAQDVYFTTRRKYSVLLLCLASKLLHKHCHTPHNTTKCLNTWSTRNQLGSMASDHREHATIMCSEKYDHAGNWPRRHWGKYVPMWRAHRENSTPKLDTMLKGWQMQNCCTFFIPL